MSTSKTEALLYFFLCKSENRWEHQLKKLKPYCTFLCKSENRWELQLQNLQPYCTVLLISFFLICYWHMYTIHLSRFGNAFTLKNNHTTGLLAVLGKLIRYFLWFSHLFLQNSRHKSKISREVIQIIECTY